MIKMGRLYVEDTGINSKDRIRNQPSKKTTIGKTSLKMGA